MINFGDFNKFLSTIGVLRSSWNKIFCFQHPDQYSRTKSIAEQEILAANGKKTSDGGTLRTCALRLAGVYGPGEQRHFPRIVVSN